MNEIHIFTYSVIQKFKKAHFHSGIFFAWPKFTQFQSYQRYPYQNPYPCQEQVYDKLMTSGHIMTTLF